jgi:hypothetical protein
MDTDQRECAGVKLVDANFTNERELNKGTTINQSTHHAPRSRDGALEDWSAGCSGLPLSAFQHFSVSAFGSLALDSRQLWSNGVLE